MTIQPQHFVFSALTVAFMTLAHGQDTATPLEPTAAKKPLPAASPTTTAEPRIIRGNDVVIGTVKQGSLPEGGANSFKFEEAPLGDVVQVILKDILKLDYVLHPPINGTVTLSSREVSNDQAVFLLESALQANGVTMVRDARGTYHIGKAEALKGIVPSVRLVSAAPLPPGSGAIIVPLKFIGAAEMAAILKPLLPAEALLRVDNVRNLLILAGNRTQAEGWLDMVNTFDVDLLKGMSVGVFPLKFATVKEVEAALKLMTPGGATSGGTASGGPGAAAGASAGGEGNPFFGAIRILPIERINSVLVVTPRAAYLEEAKSWIDRLDRPDSNSSERQLNIYAVQNGSAKHLASVVSGLFGGGQGAGNPQGAGTGIAPGLAGSAASSGFGSGFGSGSGLGGSGFGNSAFGNTGGGFGGGFGGGGGGFGGGGFGGTSGGGFGGGGGTGFGTGLGLGGGLSNTQGNNAQRGGTSGAVTLGGQDGPRVMADELNNIILVYSTGAEFLKIESVLKRLDLPPTQVLIEASIIEITLSDDLQYGLQWFFTDKGRNSNSLLGTGVISSVGGGTLGGALAGFSYTLRNPLGNVRAVLNALAEKSLVNVISSPTVMVLDNHVASISVGTQQPVQAGQAITTGGVVSNNIQFKDTGVNLAVTPSVNAGNMVTMQINQSVTDVGAIDTATGQRAFLQRQINSKVAVRSGEAIVLGGLIRDNITNGKSGVPYLQDIPGLGNLFGSTTISKARTELLVIITPRVVRADVDARDVSQDLRDRMKSFEGWDKIPSSLNPHKMSKPEPTTVSPASQETGTPAGNQ